MDGLKFELQKYVFGHKYVDLGAEFFWILIHKTKKNNHQYIARNKWHLL